MKNTDYLIVVIADGCLCNVYARPSKEEAVNAAILYAYDISDQYSKKELRDFFEKNRPCGVSLSEDSVKIYVTQLD